MREWTERHIRELIDDEFKKLKKPSGSVDTCWELNTGGEQQDFIYYLSNSKRYTVKYLNEEDLNGIVLYTKKGNIQYYDVSYTDEEKTDTQGKKYILRTYLLYEGLMKFDNNVRTPGSLPGDYLTSIPNGIYITHRYNTAIDVEDYFFNKQYNTPIRGDIFSIHITQKDNNNKEHTFNLQFENANGDYPYNLPRYFDEEGNMNDILGNGRTLIFRIPSSIWRDFNINKSAKLILETKIYIDE